MSKPPPSDPPNPRRAAAGRQNRAKRRGLTPVGREKLRRAAQRHQPWRYATGPRTAEGKATAARNGKARQKGPQSVRDLRAALAPLRDLLRALQESRAAVDANR